MTWHSNIQSIMMNNGKVERVSNNRAEHATKREAVARITRAKTAANKPKATIYKAGRSYTVAL